MNEKRSFKKLKIIPEDVRTDDPRTIKLNLKKPVVPDHLAFYGSDS
jgi:hypothetical protein